MPFPQPGFFGERDRASPPPGPKQKGCPSPGPFVDRAAPPVLVSALSAKGSSPEALFWGSGHPPWAILPFVVPPPLQPCASPTSGPLAAVFFVNRAASPVRVSALSAGSAPLGRAWFLGERSSFPRYSSFLGLSPSPAVCISNKRPPRRGLFCEQGSVPCAHFSTFRQAGPLAGRQKSLLSDRRPFPSSFSVPPSSPATATCNKSSTAVDFWRSTPSQQSRSGRGRALASIRRIR